MYVTKKLATNWQPLKAAKRDVIRHFGGIKIHPIHGELQIFLGFVGLTCARPSNLTDLCILSSGVKCLNRRLLAFQLFNWTWPFMLISDCFLMFFCLACNTVPENWHSCINKGLTDLLIIWSTKNFSTFLQSPFSLTLGIFKTPRPVGNPGKQLIL